MLNDLLKTYSYHIIFVNYLLQEEINILFESFWYLSV